MNPEGTFQHCIHAIGLRPGHRCLGVSRRLSTMVTVRQYMRNRAGRSGYQITTSSDRFSTGT